MVEGNKDLHEQIDEILQSRIPQIVQDEISHSSGTNPLDQLSSLYATFASRIDHEDTLFNSRITWLVSFQSFLLLPFFLIQAQSNIDPNIIPPVIRMLGIVASLSNLFVFFGCFAADRQIDHLTRKYRERLLNITNDENLINLYQLRPKGINDFFGALTPYGTILLFAILWLVISRQQFQNLTVIFLVTTNVVTILLAGIRICRARFSLNIFTNIGITNQQSFFTYIALSLTSTIFAIAFLFNLLTWHFFPNVSNFKIIVPNVLGFILLGITLFFIHLKLK